MSRNLILPLFTPLVLFLATPPTLSEVTDSTTIDPNINVELACRPINYKFAFHIEETTQSALDNMTQIKECLRKPATRGLCAEIQKEQISKLVKMRKLHQRIYPKLAYQYLTEKNHNGELRVHPKLQKKCLVIDNQSQTVKLNDFNTYELFPVSKSNLCERVYELWRSQQTSLVLKLRESNQTLPGLSRLEIEQYDQFINSPTGHNLRYTKALVKPVVPEKELRNQLYLTTQKMIQNIMHLQKKHNEIDDDPKSLYQFYIYDNLLKKYLENSKNFSEQEKKLGKLCLEKNNFFKDCFRAFRQTNTSRCKSKLMNFGEGIIPIYNLLLLTEEFNLTNSARDAGLFSPKISGKKQIANFAFLTMAIGETSVIPLISIGAKKVIKHTFFSNPKQPSVPSQRSKRVRHNQRKYPFEETTPNLNYDFSDAIDLKHPPTSEEYFAAVNKGWGRLPLIPGKKKNSYVIDERAPQSELKAIFLALQRDYRMKFIDKRYGSRPNNDYNKIKEGGQVPLFNVHALMPEQGKRLLTNLYMRLRKESLLTLGRRKGIDKGWSDLPFIRPGRNKKIKLNEKTRDSSLKRVLQNLQNDFSIQFVDKRYSATRIQKIKNLEPGDTLNITDGFSLDPHLMEEALQELYLRLSINQELSKKYGLNYLANGEFVVVDPKNSYALKFSKILGNLKKKWNISVSANQNSMIFLNDPNTDAIVYPASRNILYNPSKMINDNSNLISNLFHEIHHIIVDLAARNPVGSRSQKILRNQRNIEFRQNTRKLHKDRDFYDSHLYADEVESRRREIAGIGHLLNNPTQSGANRIKHVATQKKVAQDGLTLINIQKVWLKKALEKRITAVFDRENTWVVTVRGADNKSISLFFDLTAFVNDNILNSNLKTSQLVRQIITKRLEVLDNYENQFQTLIDTPPMNLSPGGRPLNLPGPIPTPE